MDVIPARAGTAPAIVTGDRTVDAGTMQARISAMHAQLQRSIRPGSALGIWVENAVDLAVCVGGALAARADTFIIPPEASPARAVELCAIEGASATVCDEAHAARSTGSIRHSCGPGLVLVDTQSPSAAGPSGAGSLHFFTSGSDGRPKGVVRTRESLVREAAAVGTHLGIGPGSVVLCTAPVTFSYGFTVGLFTPLLLGGTAIVARPMLASSLSKLLTRHQPEIVFGVPAQYAAWAALRRPHVGALPRLWVSSGAPLPPAVRARFESAWGTQIAEQYGMTECGAISIDLDGAETLGRPYPGVTITIERRGDQDRAGEVVVDTPFGSCGYVGDPSGGRPSGFTPDGFRTGDTGWLDADGRLQLVGRRTHQLNVRGQKVDPAEVERAIWALDGVQDVAVVGIDRADGDQWIATFVACADGLTDEALYRATGDLEAYKRPQRFIRVPNLPKTAAGKTDRAALQAHARSRITDG